MSVLLDAIKRAGDDGGDRAAVVEQLLGTKDREGVFGKYSFDENGDITLTPVRRLQDRGRGARLRPHGRSRMADRTSNIRPVPQAIPGTGR